MTSRRTGPVRSEDARVAVLDAASRLFVERGYDRLTIEAIAAEAGVGKATIYRWWNSKGEIVADFLIDGRLSSQQLELPNSGDLRADLGTWLRRVFAVVASTEGEVLLRSLIAAAAENADVGRRLRDSLTGGSSVIDRFASAVEAGQLPSDTPLEEMSESLVGAVLIRALSRESPDHASIERLIDFLTS